MLGRIVLSLSLALALGSVVACGNTVRDFGPSNEGGAAGASSSASGMGGVAGSPQGSGGMSSSSGVGGTGVGGVGGGPAECTTNADCPTGYACACGGPGPGPWPCHCGLVCTADSDCTDPLQPVCCGTICTDACTCFCD